MKALHNDILVIVSKIESCERCRCSWICVLNIENDSPGLNDVVVKVEIVPTSETRRIYLALAELMLADGRVGVGSGLLDDSTLGCGAPGTCTTLAIIWE